MEQGSFGFPLSFAPRCYQQRTSRVGPGHRAQAWCYTTGICRTSDPRARSLRATSCRTFLFASTGTIRDPQNDGPESNLQTALTGAKTYYYASGHAFLGMTNPNPRPCPPSRNSTPASAMSRAARQPVRTSSASRSVAVGRMSCSVRFRTSGTPTARASSTSPSRLRAQCWASASRWTRTSSYSA